MRYLFLILGLLFSLSANGKVVPERPWKDIKPTDEQLKTILANHLKWLDKKKGKRRLYINRNPLLKDPLGEIAHERVPGGDVGLDVFWSAV